MPSKECLESRRKQIAVSFLLIFCITAQLYELTYSRVSIPTGTAHHNLTTHANVNLNDESRRKTNVEVLEWLRHKTTFPYRDEIVPQIPLTFPRPQRPETIKIYNATAWQELQDKLKSASSLPNETFTLLINGGSVSAGGKSSGERYFLDFIDYMQMTRLIPSTNHIRTIDRAHGSRGSIHSAMLRHSFFPPNVDLVIWEFAINDQVFSGKQNKDAKGARRSLEMWLDAIEQISPHPPFVILMYLWDSPFAVNNNGSVTQHVYDSHQSMAARYPFVVGHVNMALYVEELEWGHEWSERVFLHDKLHPTWLGHAVMGYLLLEFVTTHPDRLQRAVDQALDLQRNVTALKSGFACDLKLKAAKRTFDKGKVSIADWTAEEPRNTEIYPGMLVADHESLDLTLGKQDPTRNDRQHALGLPCCHLKEMMTLKLPGIDRVIGTINGTVTMKVQAIYAAIIADEVDGRAGSTNISQVGVLFDGKNVNDYQAHLMADVKRNCWGRHPLAGYFLLLPEPRHVNTIGLCSHVKASCAKAGGQGAILIQSVSAWK